MTKAEQSYTNLGKALASLEAAVATPPVEDRDFGGIIQAFESVYELTCKTLKNVLESNGINAPFPRLVFEEAFRMGMIEGNEVWKNIMEARNLSEHTYDKSMAVKLCQQITQDYVPIFRSSFDRMGRFVS